MIEINDKCVGCQACQQICTKDAIKMIENEEGFLYPDLDEKKCIKCGQCNKVCPVSVENQFNIENQKGFKIYGGYCTSIQTNQASSGRIFPLITKKFFDENKKNSKVYSVKMDGRKRACHYEATSYNEIKQGFGSKYIQSDLSNIYSKIKKDLDNESKVLFSGTPCQIAGLKKYLGKEYEKLLTQAIFCHGVASPKVFKKYCDYVENTYNKMIKSVSFRSKKKGWEKYGMEINFLDGGVYYKESEKDLFHKTFGGNISLRKSCYNCQFKYPNYQADIIIGDFWNVGTICPKLYDKNGVSIIIIGSEKGKKFIDKIKSDMKLEEIKISDLYKSQKGIKDSVAMNLNRTEFFEKLDKEKFDSLVNRLTLLPIHKRVRIILGKTYKKILFNILRKD